MPKDHTLEIPTVVERKQSGLPRYCVIPSAALKPWGLTETTTVDIAINGQVVERRTIKFWDESRWFLSVTEKDCRTVSIDTGSRVVLTLKIAAVERPIELATLLKTDPAAAASWNRLTRNQQRMLRDNIDAAKQPATRLRRAQKELKG